MSYLYRCKSTYKTGQFKEVTPQIEKVVEDGVNEQKTPSTGVGKPWS